jgi:hypothetical protein
MNISNSVCYSYRGPLRLGARGGRPSCPPLACHGRACFSLFFPPTDWEGRILVGGSIPATDHEPHMEDSYQEGRDLIGVHAIMLKSSVARAGVVNHVGRCHGARTRLTPASVVDLHSANGVHRTPVNYSFLCIVVNFHHTCTRKPTFLSIVIPPMRHGPLCSSSATGRRGARVERG